MGLQDRWLRLQWVWLLLTMASTASALTLSSFEIIISASLPLSCTLAYNSPIFGCTMNDFVQGNTCSATCVRSLLRLQATIQSVCDGVDVPSTSVLGRVLSGDLVELVCEEAEPEPETTTTTSSPSMRPTTARSISVTPVTSETPTTSTTPTSTKSVLTFTVVRPTSTTLTTSTTAAETETTELDSSTSTSSTSEVQETTLVQSSTQATESSTSSEDPKPTGENSSGGGSPFDLLRSGSSQLAACWANAAVVALGVGLVLLR